MISNWKCQCKLCKLTLSIHLQLQLVTSHSDGGFSSSRNFESRGNDVLVHIHPVLLSDCQTLGSHRSQKHWIWSLMRSDRKLEWEFIWPRVSQRAAQHHAEEHWLIKTTSTKHNTNKLLIWTFSEAEVITSCSRTIRAVNLWVDSESIWFMIHMFSIWFKNNLEMSTFRMIRFDSQLNLIQFD